MSDATKRPPVEHHYVPQFYLRRFACREDSKKIRVLERYGSVLVADRKSVERIGYENHLHDFIEHGEARSIEQQLNKSIETPFSNGPTWSKIASGDCASLDASDSISLYGFARHLQRRNLATLRFIQREHDLYLAGALESFGEDDLSLHKWLSATKDGAHRMFREGAMDRSIPDDFREINIMVCNSSVPFRSSTNPTLIVSYPGIRSVLGEMFGNLRTWWLSLDPNCGAFIIAGGPPGFSNQTVPSEIARVINRRFLVQMLHSEARYLLADDPFIEPDLEWAGFTHEKLTTHGFRYQATTWKDPKLEEMD